jgi:signal transduction histidine kinase
MRLHTKIGICFVLVSVLLFGLGGWVYFVLVRDEIAEEVDERLYARKAEIAGNLHRLAAASPLGIQLQVDTAVAAEPDRLVDTLIWDARDEEHVPFRQLTYVDTENGVRYRATLRQSLIETEDLVESIGTATLVVAAAMILALALINLLVSRRLWAPFYRTLRAVGQYDVNEQQPLALDGTATEEFRRLNDAILGMTERIRRDFLTLKAFTENASHELQTPLAIIISKIESLLDTGDLGEDQYAMLQDIHGAASRLSQLNKGLLLLTRIEGGVYTGKAAVAVRAQIENVLSEYEELISLKSLVVLREFKEPLEVSINPDLAAVLVSTLLTNAIVHNVEGGEIRIAVSGRTLTVENTGTPCGVDPTVLFERFRKGNQSSRGLGLGLSIAREICDMNGFSIEYSCREDRHVLTVRF